MPICPHCVAVAVLALIASLPVIGFAGRWLYHKIMCGGRDCACSSDPEVDYVYDPLDPG